MSYFFTKKLINTFQKVKRSAYKAMSEISISGKDYSIKQPLITKGKGLITMGTNVQIGFRSAPFFYSNYSMITAFSPDAKVFIGANTQINNCVTIYANSGKITIGENVLIGHRVEILDTDFHFTSPLKRHLHCQESKNITIEENVFIGSNSRILKGLTIGKDSVIAAGSIVTKDVPAGTIYGGAPAKFIKNLNK